MSYFIQHVHTLNTTGRSRKGALLQAIAKTFEHTIITDDEALRALESSLRWLVDGINEAIRGKKVKLEHSRAGGQIIAHSGYSGSEAYIFTISYAKMRQEWPADLIKKHLVATLYNLDRNVLAACRSLDQAEEGGEQ